MCSLKTSSITVIIVHLLELLKEGYWFSSTLFGLFFFILPLDSSSVRSALAQPVVRFPPASWMPFKLENSNMSEIRLRRQKWCSFKRHESSYHQWIAFVLEGVAPFKDMSLRCWKRCCWHKHTHMLIAHAWFHACIFIYSQCLFFSRFKGLCMFFLFVRLVLSHFCSVFLCSLHSCSNITQCANSHFIIFVIQSYLWFHFLI